MKSLCGIEFDWFAVDNEGNIALFATCGNGIIPKQVLENYLKHIEISDSIEQPHWGTGNVWKDFTAKGLYVFDWTNDCYQKVDEPKNSPSEKFLDSITSVHGIPKINANFADISNININN